MIGQTRRKADAPVMPVKRRPSSLLLERTLTSRNTRRYRRTEVSIVVDVSLAHGPQQVKSQAVIRVLGGGGAYLEIDEKCPVGVLMFLRFKLPGDGEEMHVKVLCAMPLMARVRDWSSWASVRRIATGSWNLCSATWLMCSL